MNRRQMIRIVSMPVLMAGTRALAQTQARKYDLLLKGGRVIDPSQSFNAFAECRCRRQDRGDRPEH